MSYYDDFIDSNYPRVPTDWSQVKRYTKCKKKLERLGFTKPETNRIIKKSNRSGLDVLTMQDADVLAFAKTLIAAHDETKGERA